METTKEAVVSTSRRWAEDPAPPRLSVIVPVYNVEQYVVAALNSLVPHRRDAIEVIVVHDGGSDGSLRLCEAWVAEAPVPALLLDQPNGGLSAARMAGLRHARGESIAFVDSDDLVDAEVLMRLAADVAEFGCDVALGRAVVLDSMSLGVSRFYDAHIWDEVLRGAPFRRLTVAQEPRLLAFEPSMTTRVLRRSFVERHGIAFPLGRLFEDPPPHIQSLVCATSIGLRDETLYYYRVNRPGKITDSRGAGRFDAIASIRDAIRIGLAASISGEAGAHLLLGAARMLFWCCKHIPNGSLMRFASEAGEALRGTPAEWQDRAMGMPGPYHELVRILGAFLHGDPVIVSAMASGRNAGLAASFRYWRSGFGELERRKAVATAKRQLLRPVRSVYGLMRRAVS